MDSRPLTASLQHPRRPAGTVIPGKGTECAYVLTSLLAIPPNSPQCRFNIYIIDYCLKRGFRKTAEAMAVESDIPLDSTPPINAKQGLLFECVLTRRV